MKKVLIVEDEYISGNMLKDMVEHLGHRVIGIAPNAEKSFLYVKKTIPDLIFMDINLAGEMNGLHLSELLSGYYNIKVVFVTIHADSKTIKYAKKYGSGYIIKPFTLEDIKSTLKQLEDSEEKIEENKKNNSIIHIKIDNTILFLKYSDVIYIESQAHSLLIFTKEKEYVVRNSLKNILENDISNIFTQVHRSFIINKEYIEALINENYSYRVKLKHSETLIPVSKKYLQILKEFKNFKTHKIR